MANVTNITVVNKGFLAWKIPYVNISIIQIILFIVFLAVGIIAIRIIAKILERTLRKVKVPDLVIGLTVSLVKAIGYIIVLLSVLPTLGISTGAAGLGLSAILAFIVGFGLQDTWANMAAGIWLAVIRPFDVGDYIEVAGHKGIVQGIGVLSTILKTFDNAVITIPNKSIWGSPMINYTSEPIRRGSISIGVAYGLNLDKVINIMLETIKSHPNVLKEPAPQVVITEFADSSINLEARIWTRKEHLGGTLNELKKMIYEAFENNGIEIPFPQLDIHIKEMPK